MKKPLSSDFFMSNNWGSLHIEDGYFLKFNCKENAEILSVLQPYNTPGAYRYENADGIRFLVFAADIFYTRHNADYYNNYYRQKQLISGLEWAGGKKLPAISEKHPNLYIMTSKNENAMSVLLINIFPDDVVNPIVTLDKAYGKIKCISCKGILKENKVYLSDISPYGFAAFEVTE